MPKGQWLDTAQVPADRAFLSGPNVEAVETGKVLERIIRDAIASESPPGTPAWRVATLYQAYLQGDGASFSGQQRVKDGLAEISSIATREQVALFMADPFSHSIVGAYVWIDPGNPSRREITIDQEFFHQGALGLPDRDAYLADDKVGMRSAYRDYVADTFKRIGYDGSQGRANAIVRFETALAAAMWDEARRRDRTLNYTPMTFEALQAYAPGFDWVTFLDAMGATDPRSVILRQNSGVQAAARLVGETPLEVLKDYLAFHWVNNHWTYLQPDLRIPAERFFLEWVARVGERSPAEARARRTITQHLGGDLARLWVDANFPRQDRDRSEALGKALIAATRSWLADAEWLDEQTRALSLKKLEGFTLKIGAPDRYPSVPEDAVSDDLYQSVRALILAARMNEFRGVGTPLPPEYWYGIQPYTVDAANSPDQRALTVSAAVIRRALESNDPAQWFAGGFVVGHEIGHSFDDQGAKFDPDGVLRPWWSTETRARYDAEVAKLAEQIAVWEPIPGAVMKPEQVMGEAIGDLIGMKLAEQALDEYLADHPEQQGTDSNGFTVKQRFFLAYAQSFRTVWKPGALREYMASSYHPPGEFRVNGVVRNIDGWYEAFDIRPEHPLYLAAEDRVRL
ncbi:M13 family metallopeptidase [Erythrobacter sp.]|uniref:M13-type metalloendopeptidase n=1 Tax=Erythrobacter sp. TaxID=1042 RepID=UPI0025D1B3C8|nr:M13 family metallopeptidase [Erythrobacter sp.]